MAEGSPISINKKRNNFMYNYNDIKGCFRFKLGIIVANNVKKNFYCSPFHFENIKSVRFLSDRPLYSMFVKISELY